MVVCLVPTAVQAEEGGSEYTIESREGASTTETATQPGVGEYTEEVESVSQNGKSPTVEMFLSTNATGIASQTASVGSEDELVAALAESTVNLITLKNDIAVSATLTVDRAVTLDLVGYMLEITGSGSVIKVADGGHLTLNDSDLTATYKFTPDANGLWKWGTSGTMTINGGVIYGGNAENGGGVYVEGGGQFTMTGGNIVGCTAAGQSAQGGGVYVAANGTFTMTGGTIAGCTADGRGSDAMTVMGSGVITSGLFYGGIFGNGTVSGCTVTYQVSGADYAMQILQSGNAATKPTDPASSSGAAFLGWYKADGTEYDFTQPVTENLILTARFTSVTKQVTTWDELKDALADPTVDVVQLAAGNIYPWGSVTTLYIERTVTLDLNGYVLKGDGRSVFEIKDGGHLIVIDSDPTKEHKFWIGSEDIWKWNNESGDKTVLGGAINGGSDIDGGGGVKVCDGGRLTMNGGNIVGCDSDGEGGGVKVYGGGGFEMNGDAAIIGCVTQRKGGGGVYVEDGGTFTMNGGTIRDCVSRGEGGGGVCNKGQFTMNGGTIRNCTASVGGAVYHYNYSGAPLTLNGTIISDNSDRWQPIYAQSNGTVTIGAAADIQANMYLMNCTVLTNGGVVRGDVYVYNSITISVDEGVIQSTIFYGKFSSNYNVNGVAVTYQVNGADYATQFLNSGNAATKPDDPTAKTGYTFDGWYKADGTKWDFDTVVTENITLTGWQYLPVDNASALENALTDDTVDVIRLTKDIDISSTLTILRPVILDLNGYVLRYTNTNTVGSVFKIVTGGDLTVIDSRPEAEHKFNGDDVLWVLDEQNGKETVKGGVITGGTGTPYVHPEATESFERGGGAYVEGGGQFTMTGGNIVGCIAYYGGGVYVFENGAFTMNGGSIVGCSGLFVDAGWNPLFGGVYLYGGGTFTMTGGVIKSRTVYSVNLENATMNANGGEIYGVVDAAENSSITCLDGLTGVTIFRDLVILCNRNGNIDRVDWGLFYGKLYAAETSISGLTVTYKDGDTDYAKQVLPSGKTVTKPDDPAKSGYRFEGWYTADGTPWDYTTPVTEDMTLTAHWIINTREVTTEQELKDAMADTSMGQIRLTYDINLTDTMTVTRAVILDLNGHVLRQITNNCVSFKVESGGDLTLIDSNPTAEHRFTPDSDGLWVWDETGGTKTVKGGIITGNAQGRSGSIHVEEGTFTMTAGNLVGCNVYGASSSIGISCGAVYVDANSKFNMTGGAIQGCLVRQGNGGGVYVNGGQFTMTGGAITDCTVDGLGGGVYVLAGTFKLDGGDIRGCTAGGGGGVFVYMKGSTRGIFEMTGGSIADCTAGKGSALYLYNGIMYADGGTVDGTVWVDDSAYSNTDSRITTNGITGVTSFKKGVSTRGANSRIDYGIYYGGITGDGTVSGVTMTYLIDGAEYAKQMLPSAGLATRPDDPAAKTGYTFGGWNKADGTAWDYGNDTVTGDITLYAKWIPNTYKLTFDAKGGNDVTPKNVTYGELFGELPVPVREGYVFMGWFDAQELTQYDATTRLDKDEDLTLYAKWTLCDHKSSTKQPNCMESAICTKCAGTIPALGHDFTVSQHDETQHWNKCSRCDATDAKADHTGGKATCTEQAVCTVCSTRYGNLSGHDFTLAQHDETQHWNKCSRCEATDTKVDHTGGKATCTEQAVCTVCSIKYGNALGHNFGIPDYTWNGTECTARRVCTNDASHEESETVTATVNVTQNRSCELDELSTYTATFTNAAFAAQTKQNVVTANKFAHNFTVPQHDETQHWNKCAWCDTTDAKIKHTGGKATCTEQAVCEVCHSTYGELDGTNHVGGTKIRNKKTKSCTENGYTGDTYCKGCGKKISSGTVISADGHKGGTASCIDKAECEVCHEKYGELDGNNHIELEKVNATPATAASTGSIEYWRCTACGKLFADADGKREINSEDTVAKKLAPSILDGANGKWKKGDENGLTFKSDAAFSDFVEVLVDGKTVAPENYTKREDGIIVELKASYLETLAGGEYTLTIRSASGDATTKFTVEAEVVSSSTNSTNIWVWIISGVVALGAGVTVVVLVARKRKTV